MLALGLTLTLCAMPDLSGVEGRSARLVPDEVVLSPAEVMNLDRELRILNGNIQELRPHIPGGYVVGMVVGFSLAVLMLPGIPLLIGAGAFGATSSLLAFGGVLTAIGAVALMAALICLVMGNNAESDMADERAKLVERRDGLKKQLEPYRAQPPVQAPPLNPGYAPGVQLDLPVPRLVTLARF